MMSPSSTEKGRGAGERRYVVAYGDHLYRSVERAPDHYGDNLLTREEAARRIIQAADAWIEQARETRRRAMKVLREEQEKSRATGESSK